MGSRIRRGFGRKLSPGSKLRILLTPTEAERLDNSTAQSGVRSRAFLIAEALRAGLTDPPPGLRSGRRVVRVDAWVPAELVVRLKELAATHHLPQQHLFRLFLFQYLTVAPWERRHAEKESRGGEVLRR